MVEPDYEHFINQKMADIFSFEDSPIRTALGYVLAMICFFAPFSFWHNIGFLKSMAYTSLAGLMGFMLFRPHYWKQAFAPGLLTGPMISLISFIYVFLRGGAIRGVEIIVVIGAGLLPGLYIYWLLVRRQVHKEVIEHFKNYNPLR